MKLLIILHVLLAAVGVQVGDTVPMGARERHFEEKPLVGKDHDINFAEKPENAQEINFEEKNVEGQEINFQVNPDDSEDSNTEGGHIGAIIKLPVIYDPCTISPVLKHTSACLTKQAEPAWTFDGLKQKCVQTTVCHEDIRMENNIFPSADVCLNYCPGVYPLPVEITK